MNKADLVHALVEDCQLAPEDAETVVTTLVERMAAALAEGDKIEVRGFVCVSGSLGPAAIRRAARQSRFQRSGSRSFGRARH